MLFFYLEQPATPEAAQHQGLFDQEQSDRQVDPNDNVPADGRIAKFALQRASARNQVLGPESTGERLGLGNDGDRGFRVGRNRVGHRCLTVRAEPGIAGNVS